MQQQLRVIQCQDSLTPVSNSTLRCPRWPPFCQFLSLSLILFFSYWSGLPPCDPIILFSLSQGVVLHTLLLTLHRHFLLSSLNRILALRYHRQSLPSRSLQEYSRHPRFRLSRTTTSFVHEQVAPFTLQRPSSHPPTGVSTALCLNPIPL